MNMRTATRTALLVAMATFTPPAAAEYKAPTEAQCREMTNSMLKFMKSAPLDKERDRQAAKVVIDRAERIVQDNRARHASECESWAAISKLVTTQ
jgi:hypothetical protein